MKAFIAAKNNPFLHWLVDKLYWIALKAVQNIDDIIINPEDVELLKSMKSERMLFFSNHPTTAEPPITYQIANIMGTRFRYMASRQVFDWDFGVTGKIISNLGGFSIIAGINDRESLKTARATLAAPEGKLVLYPEGEPTSGENDNLMPFQQGVVQIALWAYEDAIKVDPNADIKILPAFMKYVFNGSSEELSSHLSDGIKKIEKIFEIDPGNKNLLRRFLTVGRHVLQHAESKYGITVKDEKDFDFRVGRVRHAILDNVADKLGIKDYKKDQDAILKLRQLIAVLEMIGVKYEDPKLPVLTKDQLSWAKGEIEKAFDFVAIKKDYLISYPSAERFYEWLLRYESYLYNAKPRMLGGVPPRKSRKAYVYLSKPISLSTYYPDYKKDKRGTAEKLLKDLRANMQSMLDESLKKTKPLVQPGDIGE
jgi:hypothetical protein